MSSINFASFTAPYSNFINTPYEPTVTIFSIATRYTLTEADLQIAGCNDDKFEAMDQLEAWLNVLLDPRLNAQLDNSGSDESDGQ